MAFSYVLQIPHGIWSQPPWQTNPDQRFFYFQRIGHIAFSDFLGKTFHNGSFPTPGSPTRQGLFWYDGSNLHNPFDFLISCQQWGQIYFLCQCRHITAEFVQCFCGAFSCFPLAVHAAALPFWSSPSPSIFMMSSYKR